MKRQTLTALVMASLIGGAAAMASAEDNPTQPQAGYGMGPGIMGGGYGMGPGAMMGGGYGMMGNGYGMMGGYGMGPGMMMSGWGNPLRSALNLSEDQQKKIQKIQEDLAQQQWAMMQAMHTTMMDTYKKYGMSDDMDVDAIMKTQTAMMNTHLQMLRNRLEAQKKMREVLTKEQREKLREMMYGGGY